VYTLDDEDSSSNDAHQTHNQAQGTHHILCSFWERTSLIKLWGKNKTVDINVSGDI
jgi:hypothetical protein